LYFVWLWLIRVVIPGLLLLVLFKLPELFA